MSIFKSINNAIKEGIKIRIDEDSTDEEKLKELKKDLETHKKIHKQRTEIRNVKKELFQNKHPILSKGLNSLKTGMSDYAQARRENWKNKDTSFSNMNREEGENLREKLFKKQ